MNRVKVWLYALLVAGVAIAGLRAHTMGLRAGAAASLDARLEAAVAQVGASTRALAREASAAAALAARDAALVEALHAKEPAPPPPLRGKRGKPAPLSAADEEAREAALREAARAALSAAEKTLGFDLPDATVVTAGNREWLSRKGQASVAEGEAMAYLRGAIAGKARRGWVRLNGVVFHAAASPAGEGAGLVVLVPLDEAWTKGVAGATGGEATISAPEVKTVSSLAADAVQPFAGWTLGADAAHDVGRLGSVAVSLGPVKLPKLPQPWGGAAAYRARAVPLDGVKNGFVVLAVPTAAPFGAVAAFHYRALAVVVGLLLVGVALGFLVRPRETPATVPDALVAAAARIERGDFAARAPSLAGRLGTISAALNKAAELAGPAAAATSVRAPDPEEFVRPLPGAPAPRGAPGPFEAAPVSPSPPPAAAAPAPFQAAGDEAPGDEETHWQQIFQEFLRTRASCGEATEGLTYEKFRLKLEGNKGALVSKYGCSTVKFQVYVKDGKAALKATPVR